MAAVTALDWKDRLRSLRARPDEAVPAADVLAIIKGVVSSIREHSQPQAEPEVGEADILSELDALATFIRSARSEVAALGPTNSRQALADGHR